MDATPPDGKSKDCLLCLVIKDGELKLCAEDADDMRYMYNISCRSLAPGLKKFGWTTWELKCLPL